MNFDTPTVIYVVLDISLGLVVIVGNLFVVCVILHSNCLRKKAMYMFVTSLAFADMCVGVTAIPFGILTKFGIPHNSPPLCITMLSFIMISTQTSIFNMMTIAIERYLAIRHPRIHYAKLTTTRTSYVITLTWIVASVVGCLPLLGWNKMNSSLNDISNTTQSNRTVSSQPIDFSEKDELDKSINESIPLKLQEHLVDHRHCKFLTVMDEDYMFFNFTVCVLLPLVTCAILYFVIFINLLRPFRPSQPLEDRKCSYDRISSRTPSVQRKTSQKTKENLYAIYMKKYTFESKKVKIVVDLHLDKQTNVTAAPACHECEVQFGTRPQSDIHPHNKDNSKKICEEDISKRLKYLALDNIRQIDGYSINKCSIDSLQADGANSRKSSYVSTPILTRSMSGNNVNWKRTKKRRQSKSKRKAHAATVLGLIVFCFFICWMPIHILNTINRFDEKKSVYIPTWLYDVGVLLSHSNSAVNFFLYSWRLKAFRKELHRFLNSKISR